MKRFRFAVAILGLGLLFLIFKPGSGTYIFPGVSGPLDKTSLPAKASVDWKSYQGGSDSRLAVLLADTKSNWLALAHGLKAAGIPFSVTTDYQRAVAHKVVLVYPVISGARLNPAALQGLRIFTGQGGTLIGFHVLGGMRDVFGFDQAVPFESRQKLRFTRLPADADPAEQEIPIDRKDAKGENAIGVYAYTKPTAPPRAVYEDGSAAILDRRFGKGRAVAFGVDLGALLFVGYGNRQESMARSYANGYEPALDRLIGLIGDLYREGEERAVTLGPVPDGKDLAVMLTHDVDYTRSLAHAVEYAEFERSAGIRATYFVQTKYIRDWNDDIILGEKSPELLQKIRDLGMELASHTVSHSYEFRHFPMGDGTESYPAYHPFVRGKHAATGGSILGELRVSRFLLEQLAPGTRVKSFRPGHLSNPYSLPQALAATGYAYSSSVTANDSLTHLPFQLSYDRDFGGETPIFEFPVTVEDELKPPLKERLPQSIELAKKIAKRGGIFVVLIHTDSVGAKLDFEKQLVEAVKGFSWFGAVEDFGAWWAARNEVQTDSFWRDGQLVVRIKAPRAVEGLTLKLPAGFRAAPGQNAVQASRGPIVTLKKLQGTVEIAAEK
ncbi:MAG: polysaccharide deacetylase family protein [Alphaproteobacteria bacterium]|nr:polysaccharide deacetylase family protein [Alphaproteobacteria bacterium]